VPATQQKKRNPRFAVARAHFWQPGDARKSVAVQQNQQAPPIRSLTSSGGLFFPMLAPLPAKCQPMQPVSSYWPFKKGPTPLPCTASSIDNLFFIGSVLLVLR